MRTSEIVFQELEAQDTGNKGHAAGAFSSETLKAVFAVLPESMKTTAETGCGKSTILFSRVADRHRAFCFDDSSTEGSSVDYFLHSRSANLEAVEFVFGPTQQTVPATAHPELYDCVLLDGPHAYPFPDLEYFYFYPHVRPGGFLVVDDVHIATIGNLVAFLQEDDMWRLESQIATTMIFRRTDAPLFDPFGDGWWTQRYNQRRVPTDHPFYLADQPVTSGDLPPLDQAADTWIDRLKRRVLPGRSSID